jgi:hypothetical protein
LIYDNYNTFIEASDTISKLNVQFGDLDSDLDILSSSLDACQEKYKKINSTLGPKWQEIRKLSNLENDLSKLKHLSELPQLFKQSLTQFKNNDISVFEKPI